jgi:chromosome segregation ATPase
LDGRGVQMKGRANKRDTSKSRQKLSPKLDGLISEIEYMKKHRDKLWEQISQLADRMQDAEVQINLNTRLLTYLCIEKLGMKAHQLRKVLKKIEKETLEDQQIKMLEEQFKKKSRRPGLRSKSNREGS